MKKFNLQEALSGKPIITRDGRKVTEIHYLMTTTEDNYKLIVVVDGSVSGYGIDGRYNSPKLDSPSDLFMDEPIVEGWINVFCSSDGNLRTGGIYPTKEQAFDNRCQHSRNYVKTIKIDNKPE